MALKNMPSTAYFFVVDTATSLGVTNLTSGDFTSIKLLQDGVLSADLNGGFTGWLDASGGFYSFTVTAAMMNYGTVLPIGIPTTATYQCYGVPIYTEGGSLDAVSGNLTRTENTLVTVSGGISTLDATVITVSGNLNRTENTLITVSGDVSNLDNTTVTVSGNLDRVEGTLDFTSGNVGVLSNNVTTVSGDIAVLDSTLTTVSGNLDRTENTLITTSGDLSSLNAVVVTVSGNLYSATDILNAVKGAVAGKKVVNAAGTQVEVYTSSGTLMSTLDKTGTGPYTWTPTWG